MSDGEEASVGGAWEAKTASETLAKARAGAGSHELFAVILTGASGSGKTAWAKWFVERRASGGERWVIIDRQELRLAALRASGAGEGELKAALARWDRSSDSPAERKISGRCNQALDEAAQSGATGVIVADAGASDAGLGWARRLLSKGFKSQRVAIKRFEAPLEELVRRDADRGAQSVGEAALRAQLKWLRGHDDQEASRERGRAQSLAAKRRAPGA